MTQFSRFIPDGYIDEGFVQGKKGSFDEDTRFKYRPMLPKESDALIRRCSGKDDMLDIEVEECAPHLIEWDMTGPDGKPVEPTAANLLQVRRGLLVRILGIIMGLEVSDIDPRWDDAKRKAIEDLKRKGDESGRPPGDIESEGNEGN